MGFLQRVADTGIWFEELEGVPQCLRYFTGSTKDSQEAQAMCFALCSLFAGFFLPIVEMTRRSSDWPSLKELYKRIKFVLLSTCITAWFLVRPSPFQVFSRDQSFRRC